MRELQLNSTEQMASRQPRGTDGLSLAAQPGSSPSRPSAITARLIRGSIEPRIRVCLLLLVDHLRVYGLLVLTFLAFLILGGCGHPSALCLPLSHQHGDRDLIAPEPWQGVWRVVLQEAVAAVLVNLKIIL